MALIQCPECGNQVSDKAAFCPKCGRPLIETTKPTSEPVISPTQQITQPTQIIVQPYTPKVPTKPRPGAILFGIVLIAIGIWIHIANMQIANEYGEFADQGALGKRALLAWAMIIGGIVELIVGSVKREGKIAFCQKCNMQVVVKKSSGNKYSHSSTSGKWLCERCGSEIR